MKKLAFALAAVVAIPSMAAAQQTATINVTAAVQSAVTFNTPTDLSFGAALTPGSGATVTPANGGKAMITYNVPTLVSISGTALSNGGTGSLPVTYSCAQATTGTSTTPTAFATTCAAGYTTSLSGGASTSHWLYVGGAISAASTTNAPAGAYTGTVTLTATYATY